MEMEMDMAKSSTVAFWCFFSVRIDGQLRKRIF